VDDAGDRTGRDTAYRNGGRLVGSRRDVNAEAYRYPA
jgi:hypothetical protein